MFIYSTHAFKLTKLTKINKNNILNFCLTTYFRHTPYKVTTATPRLIYDALTMLPSTDSSARICFSLYTWHTRFNENLNNARLPQNSFNQRMRVRFRFFMFRAALIFETSNSSFHPGAYHGALVIEFGIAT